MKMTPEQIDDLAERIHYAEMELGHEPPNAESIAAIRRVLREFFHAEGLC